MKLFSSFNEVVECYGESALIAITNIKQIIFYSKLGVQPRWIDESNEHHGKIVAYYLKSESNLAFRKWQDNKPVKQVDYE